MAAINGAYIAGAGRIIAVDTNPAKLQLATKLGATDIINPSDGDIVERIKDLTSDGVHHSILVYLALNQDQHVQMDLIHVLMINGYFLQCYV